jgi:hypothetical protein
VQLAAVLRRTVADPDEGARALFEIPGEILAGHRRRQVAPQRQSRRCHRLSRQIALGRRVHRDRIAAAERHVDRHVAALRHAGGDAADRRLHRVTRRAAQRAQRAAHQCLAGNLVGRGAGLHGGDRDHRRIQRVDVARNDRLQGEQQMRRGDQWIARQVRQRGVAGVAGHTQFDARTGRHHGRIVHCHGAGIEAGPVVVAEDPFHREAFEQPVGDHRLRPTAALLGRLEHQMHRAGPRGVPLQQRRGAKQRGGVAVMPAGVHHARIAGGVGEARGLGDRQRVHVGTQADAAIGPAARYRCDDAMSADAGDVRHAELPQLRADERGGRLLVQGELRVRVQVSAPGGQGVCKRLVHCVCG